MKRLTRTLTLGLSALLLAGLAGAVADATGIAGPASAATDASAASSAANPAGFIYGSDSWPVPITGSAPFPMTHLSGSYGGYMGMAGNWRQLSCSTGNFLAYAPANAAQANDNYINHHVGVGTGVYWYMGGPGVDPHYNGGTTAAYNWGVAAGGAGARRDGEDSRDLPGGVGGHRAARDRARAGERLEPPLHQSLAAGRPRQPPSPRLSTGPSSTASPTTSPRTRRTRSASTPRAPRLDSRSSAPGARR